MSRTFPTRAPRAFDRRSLLKAAAGLAVVAGSGTMFSPHVLARPRRKLKFAWNANAICLAPALVALERGFYERNGLDVELVNFTGSTDQLLEALATRKADAGIGMIHRWLKSLESGFDVKIVGSTHGGCSRLVGAKAAGVTELHHLKGKIIGVADMAAPGKNFFSIYLKKNGIDPERDVQWRQYPADMLDVAVEKGEIHAIADGDPNLYLIEKRRPGVFTELASNLSGEYANKVCCIVGARGDLVRNDRPAVASLTRAIVQASDFVADNPNETAAIFAKYAPKATHEDLRNMLGTLTHRHHPVGQDLRKEIEFYATDFRTIGVFKQSTDPARFARHVHVDVLS